MQDPISSLRCSILRLTGFVAVLLAGGMGVPARPVPQSGWASPEGTQPYRPGDRVDPATWVYDENLEPRRLLDILAEGPPVTVMVLFGGPALQTPAREFRGPLWCQDSFDDLAIQRAAANSFPPNQVRFIGVAVPPVFGPERYGFPSALGELRASERPDVRKALREFVERTLGLRETGLLPYHELFFDPELTLLRRSQGEAPRWSGRFKWREDSRTYGVPTIWLLSRDGSVLAPPCWGNDYGSRPPEVRYGYDDLVARIRAALSAMSGASEAASELSGP